MRLSVYHVEVYTHEEVLTIGVCASGVTDACAIAHDRAEDAGYSGIAVRDATRVAGQGTWKPGATLIY